MNRYLSNIINQFTQKKFLLLAGPRQFGKTTIAKAWLAQQHGRYLNWDVAEDRVRILKKQFGTPKPFNAILLDEVHKYSRWKTCLKGLYDKEASKLHCIIPDSRPGGANSSFVRIYEIFPKLSYSNS